MISFRLLHPIRTVLFALLLPLLLLPGALPAQADPLLFTLANPAPSVAPGQSFAFIATLTNQDAANLLSLDGSSFTFSSPHASFTDNFSSTPLLLIAAGAPGDSWTGDLFDVKLDPSISVGSVLTGSYTVDYTDAFQPASVTQNFSITVGSATAVPEIGSWAGLLLWTVGGLSLLWAGRLRARRSVLGLGAMLGLLSLSCLVQAQSVEPGVLLHSFNGSDGFQPIAGLIQGTDGALYGTTIGGFTYGDGTVFKINPDGSGFTLLHGFNNSDGADPVAGLIQGKDGALYGTSATGAANNDGTVFKLNPDGSSFQSLHIFSGSDGAVPAASLIQGKDGALYGTTQYGGVYSYGTVFKLNVDGSGFTLLHSFNRSDDIAYSANIIQGKDGALYGTTPAGGAYGDGTVFKFNVDGSGFQSLHSFSGSDGSGPTTGLIQGADGALYGTTSAGGATNNGTMFKLNPDGSSFQLIHSFNKSDGADPSASLIQGKDGALYGTASVGGAQDGGTAFKLNPDGSGFTLLHTFDSNDPLGFGPGANLIQGRDGAFYSAIAIGGVNNNGSVFRFGPAAAGLAPNVLLAGGGDALLTVNGSGFALNDVVTWNGGPLVTNFVSSTQLIALVPASLSGAAGSAQVSVWDPNINTASNLLVALIGKPQIQISAPSTIFFNSILDHTLIVTLTLRNTGTAPAANLTLTSAVLGGVNATGLPKSVGLLAPGASTQIQITFPAGVAYGPEVLSVKGGYTGGSVGGTFRVDVVFPD